MPQPSAEELAQKARLVFVGTVQKTGAATMDGVAVSDRTAVVRVDEIVQAPEAMRAYLGQEITVQMAGRQNVQEGQQLVFYANGWLFGDSIAVQSIGQHAPARMRELSGAAAAFAASPEGQLANRDLQQRVAEAQTVVTGRVTDVRLPQGPVAGAAVFSAGEGGEASPAPGRISEHDPEWREAVVEVEGVEKGDPQKKLVVLFPSSDDVQWYKAPKFEPGQEGVFILHQQAAPAEAFAFDVAPSGEGAWEVYTALNPADFQPPQQLPVVQTIIANTSK